MSVEFYYFLKTRLQEPLPGRKAQMKMAPRPVNPKARRRKTTAPPEAHPSSVLMLLYPDEEQQLHLILTLRTQTINHPGQISLPGGRAESGETAVETAMRETEEEIGLETGNIKIAGKLSDLYVQVSDNCVTPIVGFLDYSPEMKINPGEVKEAFSISLEALLDEKNLTVETWQLHNRDVHVPFWNIHSVPLWGATAMILSELLELYRGFKM